MSTQRRAFRPLAPTQSIAASGTAQTITLNYQIGTNAARVWVNGTLPVFIEINDAISGKVATATASMPIAAGNTEVFTIGNGSINISVISTGTGSTFYVTQGEGM